MILRTTSKLVCYSGRSGKKSYAVAALAATANKSENGSSKANDSDGVSHKIKGKRIPKDQRRAMVEAFVSKYKAMNDGKFPSSSNVKKQVGGSYYVVKKILQELEHQLKVSSINNANQNTTGKGVVNGDGCLSDAKEVLTSRIQMNDGIQNDIQMVVNNSVEIDDASGKHAEAERGSQYSPIAEKMSSKEDCYSEFSSEQSSLLRKDAENIFHSNYEMLDMTEAKDNTSDFIERPGTLLGEEFENVSHPMHENPEKGREKEASESDIPVFVTEEHKLHVVDTNRVSHLSLENMEDDTKKKAVSGDLQDKDGSPDKPKHHEENSSHKPVRDTFDRQTSEVEQSEQSTLWETLKSFASGIINIWRKS